MTKEIPLTQGKVAIVDDCDYEYLSQFKWFAHKNKFTWYAQRNSPYVGGKRHAIHMHHVVLGASEDERVDHINADGLNNTRGNLRVASYAENNRNARVRLDNTSGYKGVSWHKAHKKWKAHIRINNRLKHLGYFETAEEAALIYDMAARENYGDFARPNYEFAMRQVGDLSGAEL